MKLSVRQLFVAAAIFIAVALIYARRSQIGSAEHHQFEAALNQLQEIDEDLDQDIIRARYQVLDNYDIFPNRMERLHQKVAEIATVPIFVTAAGLKELREKTARYAQLLDEKERLLETFKSQNAVLNNSLRYLPIIATELRAQFAAGGNERDQIEISASELLQQVLLYSANSREDQVPEIRESLSLIGKWTASHPLSPLSPKLSAFAVHANAILGRKPKVERLTSELLSFPLDRQSAELEAIYAKEFEKALSADRRDRWILQAVCALLLLATGYTMYQLEIANRRLGQRVHERTNELQDEVVQHRCTIDERDRLFATSLDLLTVGGVDGYCRRVNPSFERLLGWSPEECLRQPFFDLIHPDDRPIVQQNLERLRVGGEIHGLEIRSLCKDDSFLWISWSISAADADGIFYACGRDVTEQRRVANILRESERRYRDLIQALPAAIYTCDAEGRITLCNQAAADLWGRQPNESDRWCGSIQIFETNGRALPAEECPMAQTIRQGAAVQGRELIVERPDGSRAYVFPYPEVLRGDNGEVIGGVNMLVDLTERHHAEEELARLNQQLRDASRHAGMAEIATNVLHNVGNVLNSVNVSASVVTDQVRQSSAIHLGQVVTLLQQNASSLGHYLSADPVGRQLPEFLASMSAQLVVEQQTVLSELSQLEKNIDHIKDIVSVQQSYASMAGVRETVNLIDLIEDSLRMNAGALVRHEVELIRDFGVRPVVNVDKHKVIQILVNLIRNAKYACDEGGRSGKQVKIRVSDEDGLARVSVIDSGVGIRAENLTKIFTHGFTTRKNGHGFGLHSGALAAKELGGALRAFSEGPDLGATFVLEIPLPALESPEESPAERTVAA